MAGDRSGGRKALAHPTGSASRTTLRRAPEQGQYLAFRIAGEDYAVPVLEASEVLGYREPTPVPGAADWIHGLLSIRGRAIPVIDLAVKFGATERSPGGSTCIVVAEVVLDEEPTQVGLVADGMPEVVPIAAEQLSDPPLFGTLVHARYLRGMARLESGLVLILDAVGALSAEDVAQLLELEAAATSRDTGGQVDPAGSTRPGAPSTGEGAGGSADRDAK
jgi:purine-binding chemotaxis protein CheW